MNYKKAMILYVFLIFTLNTLAQKHSITSPNHKIVLSLTQKENDAGCWILNVKYFNDVQYQIVLPQINLGLMGEGITFSNNLKLLKADKLIKITESYTASHGKRSQCMNEAIEGTFHFSNSKGQKMSLVLRAYNNGIAFRYVLNGSNNSIKLTNELTSYQILPEADRWLQHFVPSYEGLYGHQGNVVEKGEWGYPGLFETKTGNKQCWMLITEAGLDSTYCATKLGNINNINDYKVLYPAVTDGNGMGEVNPTIHFPWSSPWRVVILGQLADVVESTLVEDISSPSKIKDTRWIEPGISSWVYWANNHGTKDFKKVVEYIDLAARMNWTYTLFDWEWDQMSNGGNLEDAVKYARSKGVKPLLWYNSGGPHNRVSSTPRDRLLTHESRMKEFAWLNKIGVYGIKIDFFESDKLDIIKYYLDILEDAAKFKLLVNFHGATIPRGWSRTYPNLISTEAVYGEEQYNNGPEMTEKAPEHNATLPFTRNVIGPMDYTPVAFTNSQHPHTTTYAHELALSVIFESGIQHFADRPEGFDNLPDAPKAFLREVPASWDDTKFVQGYPGQEIVLARRKADNWYVAGINGENKGGKITVKLDFLAKDKSYKVTLIGDGDFDSVFNTRYLQLTSKDTMEITWLPRGGFTALFQQQ